MTRENRVYEMGGPNKMDDLLGARMKLRLFAELLRRSDSLETVKKEFNRMLGEEINGY